MDEDCKIKVLNDEKYKVEVAKDVTIPIITSQVIEVFDKDKKFVKKTNDDDMYDKNK